MKSRAFLEFCGKGFCLDFLALSCVIVLLQSHLQNSFFHVKNLLDFFFFSFQKSGMISVTLEIPLKILFIVKDCKA